MTGWDNGGDEPFDPWNPLNLPPQWGSMEGALFDDMINHNNNLLYDPELQQLYHDAMFNRSLGTDGIIEARERLDDYMTQQYGIDFWGEFDWEAYRTWYG